MIQHYGYTFNYRTLMLDYSKNTPAIPPLCKSVADRIICAAQSSEARAAQSDLLNQMTVNEYFPGQGIASHTGFIFTSLLHTIIEFVTLACRHEIMFWPGHLHLKSGESNRDEVHTKVSVIHDATLHTHQHLPFFFGCESVWPTGSRAMSTATCGYLRVACSC